MHRYGIQDEVWFEAARAGLERRGFRTRIQPMSIVIEKEGRLPRIVASAREFMEFAERQGLRIELPAYVAADRYGDDKSNLSDRLTPSPFETPLAVAPQAGPVFEPSPSRVSTPPPAFGRAAVAEARRPEVSAVEARLAELRQDQDRMAAERRAAVQAVDDTRRLEAKCAALQERLGRLDAVLQDTLRQRDVYKLSAEAAEEKLRGQADPDAAGNDARFNQLRRFLARELHPDLAGEDAAERAVRETIFKRVWAKIEQLQ